MKSDRILLINDITGYGRVSTTAMIPVLAAYGYHAYDLPTAIVSNTLEYGKHSILDTTDQMRATIDIWKELGFSFDNIATGFINSSEQVSLIEQLIAQQSDPFVLVDPIMADNGCLYDGMYENVIECNRHLASKADILVPNYTEATLLADMYTDRSSLYDDEYRRLSETLLDLGAKQAIISGCVSADDGSTFNLVQDANYDSYIAIPFERCPEQFVGTGDVFSAIIIAEYLKGNSLSGSVDTAAAFIRVLIRENSAEQDHYDINIEKCLRFL